MAKGIYIEMGHHPQVILDTMDQVERGLERMELGRKLRRGVGIALIPAGVLAFILAIILEGGPLVACLGFAMIFAGVALLVIGQTYFVREHFAGVYQLLHTMRDDTGRRGRVVGWLDLTGPRQKEKRVRTARSGGGKQKEYFVDPWFQAKIKLVDGNLLRLALEDKVKVKAGSVVAHRSELKAKLVVNPNLYHFALPSGGLPLSGAALADEGGVVTLTAEVSAQHPPIAQILETLKVLYASLQPIGQAELKSQG